MPMLIPSGHFFVMSLCLPKTFESLAAICSAPSLGNPQPFTIASLDGYLKILGRGLPVCLSIETVPISTCPKPIAAAPLHA